MPRQHELPHTSAPIGPCDTARDAYTDACETASDANSAKKQRLSELIDAMLTHGVPRVAVVDPRTNKRKWLEITEGEPKLRSVKAEAGELVESPADRRRRTASAAENSAGMRLERANVAGSDDTADQSENAATLSSAQESDSVASGDLRTPGQQRRKRGAQ